MLPRLVTLVALVAVAYVPAAQTASAPKRSALPTARSARLAAPTGLRAFLLRADEPTATAFPRTPSFAWSPYDGATGYEFQLATSKTFDERTIVWSTAARTAPLKVPAVTVPIALPWMTGDPYALYVRVRATTARGTTRWSAPFGFNMGPGAVAAHLTPDLPGLMRWTPVEGATGYEVWFTSPEVAHSKVIRTTTNVADEREVYAVQAPDETGIVLWRVRAVRQLYGSVPSGVPVVSYGPWSEVFVSVVAPRGLEPLRLVESASDTIATGDAPASHNLTPGFVFTGSDYLAGTPVDHYRVYVASDRQCVNIVYTGSVVESPAYAPRTTGPIVLDDAAATATTSTTTTTTGTTTSATTTTTATTTTPGLPDFPVDGSQSTLSVDGHEVTPNEQGDPGSTAPSGTTTTQTTTTPADGSTDAVSPFTAAGPFVDLWDLGRPNARYWWTVVPVVKDSKTGKYQDAALPQDLCEAGRVAELAKASKPVVTSATRPFVSGISAHGRLVAAASRRPSLYRAALISWLPAPGAVGYEVQWSKSASPWRATLPPVFTAATSLLADTLTPGTWYYRVRGIDPYMPGPVKQMSWSPAVRITITKPRFLVENGVTIQRAKKKR